MGAAEDSNTLNHLRYDNGQAVSAVLEADGEGSGLDADQVDGLEAAEIINAIAVASSTGYVFVGFSTNSIMSGGGPITMHSECKADFGPMARMSWTREVVDSAPTTIQTGTAWIRPTVVHVDCGGEVNLTGSRCFHLDYSGQHKTSSEMLDCSQWTNVAAIYSGLYIDGTTMVIRAGKCDASNHGGSRRVACSIPVSP